MLKAKGVIRLFTVITTGIILLTGCKKGNEPAPPSGEVTNTEINTWIKDSLSRYYYWADDLSSGVNTNQGPVAYFNNIKNSADRFSYILFDGKSSVPVNSRSKYGFDYVIFTEPSSNRVLGLITLALNTSPAQRAGLRRGQYFTKVNGILLTAENVNTLKDEILSQKTVKLMQATLNAGIVKETGSVDVIAAETLEQTALQNTFTTTDGKKVGYLFFTAFNDAERQSYLTVFADFKAQGITDFILDLRYNAGGDVSAAATMCSMLAPGIKERTPFIEYRGNKNAGIRKESFSVAAAASNGPSFASLQQRNLNLSRLYVLTTAATASSAELMINNLKPYINVIQIGQTTRGKDEASTIITDKRNPKRINVVLSPIVYKLFNALGEGGYSGGIAPKKLMIESANLPLQSFGNPADPMISYAMDAISGKVVISLKPGLVNFSVQQPELYNSATEVSLPVVTTAKF